MTVQSLLTDDVDEANAIANDVFYESWVEPVRSSSTPFRFEMQFDAVGPMTFGILSHGCEISARVGGLDMTYSVGVPLTGTFSMQFGAQDVAMDPLSAVVTTPTSHVSYRGYRTGTERLVVLSFDRDQLDNHLRNLLGRDRVSTIKFDPSLDLRQAAGNQWWQMTRLFTRTALRHPDSLVHDPMMSAPVSSAIMTGLLLAADHPFREALSDWTRPAPPSAVRRAMDIIERRAHEPLTVVDIAVAVGCSVRTLQISFKEHLDQTPSDYLRRVRMDRVHDMLRFANPETTTVTEVARSWGFNQLGRFAGQYRKIYGVSPSVTLEQ